MFSQTLRVFYKLIENEVYEAPREIYNLAVMSETHPEKLN